MANEGTSLRGMDNNFLFLCVLQVTLANGSIVLYMCEGKVLMDILFPQVGLPSLANPYIISAHHPNKGLTDPPNLAFSFDYDYLPISFQSGIAFLL